MAIATHRGMRGCREWWTQPRPSQAQPSLPFVSVYMNHCHKNATSINIRKFVQLTHQFRSDVGSAIPFISMEKPTEGEKFIFG